jgi:hypothetical protein
VDRAEQDLRDEAAHERDGEQCHEQAAEKHVGQGCGGVLEIGPAVEEVGDGDRERLCGHTADGVGVGELGVAVGGGDGGHDDAAQRGEDAEENGTEDRLAPAGAVGENVAEPGEADAAQDGEDGSRGEDEGREQERGHPVLPGRWVSR